MSKQKFCSCMSRSVSFGGGGGFCSGIGVPASRLLKCSPSEMIAMVPRAFAEASPICFAVATTADTEVLRDLMIAYDCLRFLSIRSSVSISSSDLSSPTPIITLPVDFGLSPPERRPPFPSFVDFPFGAYQGLTLALRPALASTRHCSQKRSAICRRVAGPLASACECFSRGMVSKAATRRALSSAGSPLMNSRKACLFISNALQFVCAVTTEGLPTAMPSMFRSPNEDPGSSTSSCRPARQEALPASMKSMFRWRCAEDSTSCPAANAISSHQLSSRMS
mmetsp:Transcript_47450/g.85406  ORF Transcript_47450/g.85406 Transcript_47450/m.85406 type:complete len:280 (-) Transcript_47450:3933-4772(-)